MVTVLDDQRRSHLMDVFDDQFYARIKAIHISIFMAEANNLDIECQLSGVESMINSRLRQ